MRTLKKKPGKIIHTHRGQLEVPTIANFGNATKSVTLSFSPVVEMTDQIEAPAVEAYQPARTFAAAESVPCASKCGWLLVVGAKFKLSHRPGSRTLRHLNF